VSDKSLFEELVEVDVECCATCANIWHLTAYPVALLNRNKYACRYRFIEVVEEHALKLVLTSCPLWEKRTQPLWRGNAERSNIDWND
jgi:hypothetical protein